MHILKPNTASISIILFKNIAQSWQQYLKKSALITYLKLWKRKFFPKISHRNERWSRHLCFWSPTWRHAQWLHYVTIKHFIWLVYIFCSIRRSFKTAVSFAGRRKTWRQWPFAFQKVQILFLDTVRSTSVAHHRGKNNTERYFKVICHSYLSACIFCEAKQERTVQQLKVCPIWFLIKLN